MDDNRLSRRRLLQIGAVVGAGSLVTACGHSSSDDKATSSATSASAGAGKPVRGGTLRVGITGATTSDVMNPLNVVSSMELACARQLFNSLVAFGPDAKPRPALAQEVTPNKSGTRWTIRLRNGVTFHDGRPLTADDVIYTFKRIVGKKSPQAGALSLASLDVKAIRKRDKLTLELPFTAPFATLFDLLPCYYFYIVPVGFDSKKPIGTGPFKLDSFTPGQEATFSRNENYWVADGQPYADKVVLTNFADETSELNALIGGQIDAAALLSADSIPPITSGGKTIAVSNGGGFNPITMRVDTAPFDDPRVRKAVRLLADRQQMLDLVFGGRGTIGNDIFSPWDQHHPGALPQRERDVEQAKSLLKAAGRDGATVEFVTSPIAQGAVKTAQVLAEQASEAGLKIKLRSITPSDFFSSGYLKYPFSQDYWNYFPYLPQVSFATLPTSPYNETHFADKKYARMYAEGLATVDAKRRHEIVGEMQRIDYEQGGYLIPFFPPTIDGYAKNVKGTQQSRAGVPMGDWDLGRLWMT
jgi:peptide/nickel transport system substrate-binding protein